MTECRFCGPLPCEDWHDAAKRLREPALLRGVHADLPQRYWAEVLKEAQNKAKVLHRAHKKEPDYRLNMETMRPAAGRKQLSPEQREKKAKKARERRAAAKAAKA